MSNTDPIADMLTRIRNGILVRRKSVDVPASRLKSALALALKDEGYLRDVEVMNQESTQPTLRLHLKYDRDGESAIHEISRISKPGARIYTHSKNLTSVRQGLGRMIVTTSKGIMSGRQAAELGVGGEVLCTIF